jgi:hypothetical protein
VVILDELVVVWYNIDDVMIGFLASEIVTNMVRLFAYFVYVIFFSSVHMRFWIICKVSFRVP